MLAHSKLGVKKTLEKKVIKNRSISITNGNDDSVDRHYKTNKNENNPKFQSNPSPAKSKNNAAISNKKVKEKKNKSKIKASHKTEKQHLSKNSTQETNAAALQQTIAEKGKEGEIKTSELKNAAISSKMTKKRKSKSRMKKVLKKKTKQQLSTSTISDKQDKNFAAIQTAVNEEESKMTTNRKRKSPKKTISGSSNWAVLCSELKTDPLVRKTHPLDQSEEEDDVEEPAPKVAKPEVWFDVDKELLETSDEQKSSTMPDASKSLVKEQSFTGQTKCVGMDCEMVGTGKDGEESILARVSLVNIYGNCLYDKFVLPREKVTDYRTAVSGVTKEILDEKAEPFLKVQKEVSDIIQGRILVGHALQNDLKVLFLSHPHKNIRDTSIYKPFRELFKGQKPSLKKLTEKVLGVKVQQAAHSSVEDAQAAMRLYTLHRKKWEKELKNFARMKDKKKAKLKKKEKESHEL